MFVNSNLDINSLSIVNDNKSIKVCSLCKNIDKSTENLKAYNLVMEAYEYLNNPIYSTKMKNEITEPLAEEALKLDSTYAEAYAILSLAKLFKWMDVPTKNN